MIEVSNLSFSFGLEPLYQDVSFKIGKGQKIGLVGPNGSGKTTLLNLLQGVDMPQAGRVEVIGSTALVPQEVKYDPLMEKAHDVRSYVDPDNNHEDHEIQKLFAGLELKVNLTDKPQNFSGGQKTKLALARALMQEPDVLLLDEPTNFMDTAGKSFVMQFLRSYPSAVILISHDLALLDDAIDKVLSINPQTRLIEEYKGNYSKFLKLKAEKEELLKRQIVVKQKHIKQMEEGLHKMTRFSSAKGVRARVRQQRRIEKEKLELPAMPTEGRMIKVKLPEPANVGELPIRAIHLNKAYSDRSVLKDVNFTILRGERIALLGPNGVGKSTFLKILMGLTAQDSGEVIKNPQVKIGYYSQEFETYDLNKTVLDTFIEATKKDESFARGFLGRFLFIGDKVFQRMETLSGGEKTRLAIAILTGQDYNLLILDEPTTYLDVMSQRIILESLKQYQGAMIIVSHTPQFLKELAPSRAFLFPDEKMVFWDDELLDQASEV